MKPSAAQDHLKIKTVKLQLCRPLVRLQTQTAQLCSPYLMKNIHNRRRAEINSRLVPGMGIEGEVMGLSKVGT